MAHARAKASEKTKAKTSAKADAKAKPNAKPTGKEPDDVRERVLHAAIRLIDSGGLASLSLREVAREAGVSHQAPYHYFADREAILAALAEQGFLLLTESLDRARDPGKSAAEHVVLLGKAYVHFACEHASLFRIMFRPDVVAPERFPKLLECGERAFQMLPTVVEQCIAEGFPADPSFQAHVVLNWSVVHGLACLLLDGPLALKLPDAVKERDQLIDEVTMAMRLLIEARTAAAPKAKRRLA
jgi:AcrR family transcriptional regulator